MSDRDLYLRMFRTMAAQRELSRHAGHEAVSVGTAAALRPDDLICSPYHDLAVHSGRSVPDVHHPGHLADTWAVAAGSAFAARFGEGDRVVLGYDTQTRGSLREALDIAVALGLPCIFVVPPGAADPAGMPREEVDGLDVIAVYEATLRAARRARAGDGPTLIEASPAPDRSVRRDPVEEFAGRLTGLGVTTAGELDRIRSAAAVHDSG